MSGIIVSARMRQNVISPHATVQDPDGRSDDIAAHLAEHLLQGTSGHSTRSSITSTALSARRSIAISALALAGQAQVSVLHLLR
jgi:hypothetical protein